MQGVQEVVLAPVPQLQTQLENGVCVCEVVIAPVPQLQGARAMCSANAMTHTQDQDVLTTSLLPLCLPSHRELQYSFLVSGGHSLAVCVRAALCAGHQHTHTYTQSHTRPAAHLDASIVI